MTVGAEGDQVPALVAPPPPPIPRSAMWWTSRCSHHLPQYSHL